MGVQDRQTHAGGRGGRDFRGMVLTARVHRSSWGPESVAAGLGARGTFPSSFRTTPSTSRTWRGGAELNVPAPFAIVLRLGAGVPLERLSHACHRVGGAAAGTASGRAPSGWPGALSRRAWVRADYRRERRNPTWRASTSPHAFIAQVGFGFLGTPDVEGGAHAGGVLRAPLPLLAQSPASPAPPTPEYRVGQRRRPGSGGAAATTTSRARPRCRRAARVTLPLLGEVEVSGLTVPEIKDKLTTLLGRDYLVRPQVEVTGQGLPEPVRDGAGRGGGARPQALRGPHAAGGRAGRCGRLHGRARRAR